MSKFSHPRTVYLLAVFATVLALSACTTTAPEKPAVAAEPEAVCEYEPWEGDGMDIPLDGSSMEAWNCSLERVKAHTSESSYLTLENSIQYHLLYDLKSYRDMDKLIQRLDGSTGNELVERVQWRTSPRERPTKKSADAKNSTES